MSIDDIAERMTLDILGSVGNTGVTFYPVRAAEVAAYLAAGNAGVDVVDANGNPLGAIEFLPIETDTGDVAVDSERVTFDTDDTTISANGIVRNTCIEFKGIRYDVYRVLPDGLGLTRCWLRRYFGG